MRTTLPADPAMPPGPAASPADHVPARSRHRQHPDTTRPRTNRARTHALARRVGIGAAVLAGSTLALAPTASAQPGDPETDTVTVAPVAAEDTAEAPTAASEPAATTAATTPRLTRAQRQAIREKRRAARVRAIRSEVVQVARNQLRDSYVAGASGPNAFDCSGFTRFVWRQGGGKDLPHYSRAQYRMGRKVSVAKARPGDLVFFFGGGAHHVGLYIGNNKMIHAANPRADVLVSDIRGPWYGPRFSGIRSIIRG